MRAYLCLHELMCCWTDGNKLCISAPSLMKSIRGHSSERGRGRGAEIVEVAEKRDRKWPLFPLGQENQPFHFNQSRLETITTDERAEL